MGGSAAASFLCALFGAITVVAYVIYGIMYDYFDTVVFLALVLGAGCALGYALVQKSQFLNLVSVACNSFGVGLFFLNSYPVWADRLNGITMYGSRGTLVPVIAIIIMSFLCVFIEIVSCFLPKEKVVEK